MIDRKLVFAGLLVGALALGVACTQYSTPTPTPEPTQQGAGAIRPPLIDASRPEGAGFTTFAASPQYSNGTSQSGVWVSGSGRAVVVPDLALLSLGVEARALTVEQAHSDAAAAMFSIMGALTNAGIEKKDIRTQYFNIQPEYTWNDTDRKQELTGYRVTNTVSVKVRDIEGVGSLIDQVSSAGGDLTRINSISFTVEHPELYVTQAREAAVKDAMAKGQQFANLTGILLGKLVYIAESSGNIPVVRDFAEAKTSAPEAPPTSISQGEMDVTVTVQAVFGIQ